MPYFDTVLPRGPQVLKIRTLLETVFFVCFCFSFVVVCRLSSIVICNLSLFVVFVACHLSLSSCVNFFFVVVCHLLLFEICHCLLFVFVCC